MPLGLFHEGATAIEILDDEVVFDAVAVLEVTDRVDADRIRNAPCLFCQRFHGRDDVGRECIAIGRLQYEEEVVVLRVGGLEVFECDELGILVGEEGAIVIRELESGGAGGDQDGACDRGEDDGPAPADHCARQARGQPVDGLE